MAKFKFRSNQTIGAAAAELDGYYLSQCFVDTGDLEIVCDCEDSRRIIVGRTGVGKSALISTMAERVENLIIIRPESLALTYISNSNVIKFFIEAGVKMDIFYRLLWRHVFVVEILKARFRIDTEASKITFVDSLWRLVPKRKQHEEALEYLRNWGESFWKETEYRIQEVTSTLEDQLSGAVEGSFPGIGGLSASAARKLTEEQREEVVTRAQDVVNRVQIRELSTVIDLLGEVLLTDRQKKYYVAIDKLDEDWVEDRLRFRLIRALIETSLDFARITNVKIVIALRNDLLDRVFRYTRDAGFQEEKYRTSSLYLAWTRDQLIEVLDRRIGVLVREKYTKQDVTYDKLLPKRIGKQSTIDYMLARTHMRPRDIIQFFNACIRHADGKATISARVIREAEGTYSRERLRALADEWFGLYPNLMHLAKLLANRREVFAVKEIPFSELEENYLQLLVSGQGKEGLDLNFMTTLFEGGMDLREYRETVVLIFYKVGLLGLKIDEQMGVSWAEGIGQSVSRAELDDDTRVFVHRAYWRALGVPGSSSIDDGAAQPFTGALEER